MHRLGYRIGGLSRSKRWQILAGEAVPRFGLEKVVRSIAAHRRRALGQSGGAARFAHAVADWEHDLARLITLSITSYGRRAIGGTSVVIGKLPITFLP